MADVVSVADGAMDAEGAMADVLARDGVTDADDVTLPTALSCERASRCLNACARDVDCAQRCRAQVRPTSREVFEARWACLTLTCGSTVDADCLALGALNPRCASATGLCASDTDACDAPNTRCGEACTFLDTDRANCGACGRACAGQEYCAGGTCRPPLGSTLCAGRPVNLTNDRANCGACGNACGGALMCSNGSCGTACPPGSTNCGGSCVALGADAAHCGACGRACGADATCAGGVCVAFGAVGPVGCADGTREGFNSLALYPRIAACSGAWTQGGLLAGGVRSGASVCARAGNHGPDPRDGARACGAPDLCAPGWHLCRGGEVQIRTSGRGCAASRDFAATSFFAAAVASTGCLQCALRTGTVTGSTCSTSSCMPGCIESPALANDLFGCGNVGMSVDTACDGLDRTAGDGCTSIPNSWACNAGMSELIDATNADPAHGGVLCCRD
ncbi:MAG: hypothetical protein U0325_30200 [Polyangiales bacterium]